MARNRGCGITRNDRRTDGAKGGKSPVSAIPGAGAITGYCLEMVSGARRQATDPGANTLGRVPGFCMRDSRQSVAGRCPILQIHVGTQSVGINRTVQFG